MVSSGPGLSVSLASLVWLHSQAHVIQGESSQLTFILSAEFLVLHPCVPPLICLTPYQGVGF